MLVSTRIAFAALFVSLTLSCAALAQGIRPGSIDLSANGGITDLDTGLGKKGHASFGFAGGFNLASHVALSADYNYIRLSPQSQGETDKEDLQEYGVSARFALVNTRFVAPYVLGGVGGLHNTVSASFDGASASASRSGAYFTAGGGASFYLGLGLGLRPEFRYDRLHFGSTTVDNVVVNSDNENALRATVALFYQFGGVGHRSSSNSSR